MGRPINALGRVERRLHKALRNIVSEDDYEKVVMQLLSDALTAEKTADRINAAKIIIERIEGKLPDTVIHNVNAPMYDIDELLKQHQKDAT